MVVDGARLLVEEIGDGCELGEVAAQAVSKFLSGDEVEHVGHVGEDDGSGREVAFRLRRGDEFIDG